MYRFCAGGLFPEYKMVKCNPGRLRGMVCMRVAFHENNGNHANDENDSHKQLASA